MARIIEVVWGDLTAQDTEAVVNAANNQLWMGGGVAGAIKRAGGQEIETQALKLGPIPVGQAVVTGAGKLKIRFVIHAAVMGQDLATDAGKIREATRNSLLRAEELRIKSIAFPALGTGVGGFPLAQAARIMMDEVRQHLSRGSVLERVVFVLISRDGARIFNQELERGGATD